MIFTLLFGAYAVGRIAKEKIEDHYALKAGRAATERWKQETAARGWAPGLMMYSQMKPTGEKPNEWGYLVYTPEGEPVFYDKFIAYSLEEATKRHIEQRKRFPHNYM